MTKQNKARVLACGPPDSGPPRSFPLLLSPKNSRIQKKQYRNSQQTDRLDTSATDRRRFSLTNSPTMESSSAQDLFQRRTVWVDRSYHLCERTWMLVMPSGVEVEKRQSALSQFKVVFNSNLSILSRETFTFLLGLEGSSCSLETRVVFMLASVSSTNSTTTANRLCIEQRKKMVYQLAKKHMSSNIARNHLAFFLLALVKTLKSYLGAQFSFEEENAWMNLCSHVFQHMTAGAGEGTACLPVNTDCHVLRRQSIPWFLLRRKSGAAEAHASHSLHDTAEVSGHSTSRLRRSLPCKPISIDTSRIIPADANVDLGRIRRSLTAAAGIKPLLDTARLLDLAEENKDSELSRRRNGIVFARHPSPDSELSRRRNSIVFTGHPGA